MSERSIVRLCKTGKKMLIFKFTVELDYNDLSLYDTSVIVLYTILYCNGDLGSDVCGLHCIVLCCIVLYCVCSICCFYSVCSVVQ